MLGYPGAGKTTAAKIICQLTGAVHLWADHERRQMFDTPKHTQDEHLQLYDKLNKRTDKLLSKGTSVMFDTNFSFHKDRQHLRSIAAKHGAKVVLVHVAVDKLVAKERANNNSHLQHTRVLGDMSDKDFERIAGNIELPKPGEHVVELDGTKISTAYIKQMFDLG